MFKGMLFNACINRVGDACVEQAFAQADQHFLGGAQATMVDPDSTAHPFHITLKV